MQPLKITLLGNYYDCQLYRGRLYLWTFDGDLCIYDWNQIIDTIIGRGEDWLTYRYGYKDGRYLYGSKTKQLFEDEEFKQIVMRRYDQTLGRKCVITEEEIIECLIGKQQATLPIDTEIYNSTLYYATDKGLFCATAHRPMSEKYKVSTKPRKLWDARVLNITANDYPQIAVSAGSEGLYEFRPSAQNLETVLQEIKPQLYKVSERFSLFSNYVYESIYSSSLNGKSYVSMFRFDRDSQESYHRVFDKYLDEKEFTSGAMKEKEVLSWGIRDKVYQVSEKKLRVLRFDKWREYGQDNRLIELAEMDMDMRSRLIRGGAASFGNVLEFEDYILVLQSDDTQYVIPGEATRWRVYPRSINYVNQLHVIQDDRVEFYSFNHDSQVDQQAKMNGIEYYVPTSKGAGRMYEEEMRG